MYCPRCSTQNDDNNSICKNCGFDFTTLNTTPPQSQNPNIANGNLNNMLAHNEFFNASKNKEKTPMGYWLKLCVYLTLSIIVLVMFFLAAKQISESGKNIMMIQSVGGKTLEEAYYSELGVIYSAYATIARALGLFFASVLVWLGIKKG